MAGYRFFYLDAGGIEWTITDNVHCVLEVGGMSGFGVPALEIAAERRPYRDGMVRTGRPYTGPRLMQLAHLVMHNSHAEIITYMRTLISHLTPYTDTDNIGYLIMATPDGLRRAIPAWLSEMPDLVWDGPTTCRLLLSFWSESPWFYDTAQQSTVFGLSTPGGVTFPAAFDVATGLPFASSDIDSRVSVVNAGDVETWPIIRIYGAGNDPVIENETTGKEMDIAQHMDALDYIDIDMDAGTVNFWDNSGGTLTNVISLMAADSVFWPLCVGENTLHVTMSAIDNGSIRVMWYNRFLSGL
jgi:hypothetical protein